MQMGREMGLLSFPMRLLGLMLLVAATVCVSKPNVDDEATLMETDATQTRRETGNRKLLEYTTQQSTGLTLPDDGSGAQLEQSMDDQLSEVDEGRHLMERFYQRYNTTTQVDLVFVLDRSGSVPQKGWHSVVEFVKVRACSTLFIESKMQ